VIGPALLVVVFLVVGFVALFVKLARSERASPKRRDWTNRETALFLATQDVLKEQRDRIARSKGWGKYRRH
jgi:hypothetical protein